MFEIFDDPDVDQMNEADFKLSGFEFGNNFLGSFLLRFFHKTQSKIHIGMRYKGVTQR